MRLANKCHAGLLDSRFLLRCRSFVALALVARIAMPDCLAAKETGAGRRLPLVRIASDDTRIRESCEIEIAPGAVIQDTNHNGVILVESDNLILRFKAGSALRGAPPNTPWDRLQGIGIRVLGRKNVVLEQARVYGFKNGVVASDADGLVIRGGDYSDNFRQRLNSTPSAEDSGDWLFPHHNDQTKWRDQYGGAICVENSRHVRIHEIRVRRGQNGILLDRVSEALIHDNDCSFLSGWGLAMWRSSDNLVSRNAFDFCVRGHVEGVYNRGQDSAGILCFEQCNHDVFVENSATHGGDGFFGFAGREAIGEVWMEKERERLRRETGRQEVDDFIRPSEALAKQLSGLGCNSNVLFGNDFSYASAHGIEMTFSEGNVFGENRIVENAICGLWGGYSSKTLIVGNEFVGNGGMAYGLERGAVNMEHAADNIIFRNRFLNNKCGIHLWWDNDRSLLRLPGVAGNARGVSGNIIAKNQFQIDNQTPFPNLPAASKLVVLQLRDEGANQVTNNRYLGNRVKLTHSQAVEFEVPRGIEPRYQGKIATPRIPLFQTKGKTSPVGARPHLRGRENIIMHEWGPWDHESPLVRHGKSSSTAHVYEIFGVKKPLMSSVLSGKVEASVTPGAARLPAHLQVRGSPGVTPYSISLVADDYATRVEGIIIATEWKVTVFPWKIDPRENLEDWRKLAKGPEALTATLPALDFPFSWGGPRDMKISEAITRRGPGKDHFGLIATTRLLMPAGRWRFKSLSDDGVRVVVDGNVVIENWTWHGPTPDQGVHEQTTEGEVNVMVEHFEIDGFATLRLEIEHAGLK